MEELVEKTAAQMLVSPATANMQTNAERRSLKKNLGFFLRNVTLEPTIFLNYMATTMQAVIIQALVMDQTCLTSYQHSEEFCANVTDRALSLELKKTASNYNLYRQILETAPSMLFAPFLGAWSDKYGPKMLVILPLLSDILASLVCAVTAYIRYAHPGYLLVSSALQGFTGGNLAFNLGVCSFIIASSTTQSRTSRIAMIDATFLIGATAGRLLGAFVNRYHGYVAVFVVALMLNMLAMVYTSFRLIRVPYVNRGSKSKAVGDLFRLQNLKSCLAVLLKKREKRKKCYVFIVLLCAVLLNLPRKGERNIFFIYTLTKIGFTATDFYVYEAFSTGTLILGTLIVLPTLSYCIKINDLIIVIIAIIASIANDLLIAFSDTTLMLYIAASLVLFSASASVICRSILTKCVDQDEIGKLLGLVGVLETSIPILSGILYTQVFNATINTFPGTCYLMSASLTILPALCFIWVYCELTKKSTLTSTFTVNET